MQSNAMQCKYRSCWLSPAVFLRSEVFPQCISEVKRGDFFTTRVPKPSTLAIYYSFTVFSVSESTRGHSPLSTFGARCFREELLKLNFNWFALAFALLPRPWVENRPPPSELRAPHLPTTVAFMSSFTAPSILTASSYSEVSLMSDAGRQLSANQRSTCVLHFMNEGLIKTVSSFEKNRDKGRWKS